jgi:hypothetical protein
LKDKKRIRYELILVVIIAASLLSIVYCFAFKKEGWHSDEVWSYGFANSYYKAHIHRDADGNLDNINEWVSSKTLNDYVEVNDGERFSFDSVYNNQINDLSPPLHSMVLHAICSIFPNTFSWWYSFIINIISFILCMIYLYKTAVVMKNEKIGIVCCILYGVSLAARDAYVYLRMYAMCTAMLMMLFYNMVVYIMNSDQNKTINKNLVGILVVSFLMFLTHYYMIPMVGLITLGACVILMFRKKIKKAIVYGSTQLVSLLISFAVFPSVLNMFLSHQEQVDNAVAMSLDYKLPVKIKVLIGFITYKLYGIHIYALTDLSWIKIVILIVLCILVFISPVLFLIRKTKYMDIITSRMKHLGFGLINWILNVNKIYFLIIFVVLAQIVVVALTSQMNYMGWDEGRYIMYLYPLVTLLVVSAAYAILCKIEKRRFRKICIYAVILAVLLVNYFVRISDDHYYYKQNIQGEALQKVVKNKKCIFVSKGNWAIIYMTPILRYSDEYFQTWNEGYDKYDELYREKSKEEIVIIIDVTDLENLNSVNEISEVNDDIIKQQRKYNNILDYYKKIYHADECEKVSTEDIFMHKMVAYVLK